MAFLQAHWLAIITVWTLLHVIASSLAPQFPATTPLGKALHIWVAVNPLDVVKAFKALGGSLIPTMAAGVVLCLALTGCASATPKVSSPTSSAHAAAAATLTTVKDAWKAAAQGCLQAANAQHDDTIRQKCADILIPARDSLLFAADAVDSWEAADQKNYPCLLAKIVQAMSQVRDLLVKVAPTFLPQQVADAISLAGGFAAGGLGGCS